jgi:hypothetical protein
VTDGTIPVAAAQEGVKRWARNAFFPSWRVRLLRWCGYQIGRDVYIADGLLIAEELEDRANSPWAIA